MEAYTKKELATIAGYSYRRLHDIDNELPRDKKLFVRSEEDEKKFDLPLFVQRWIAYNRKAVEEESEELSAVKAKHELVKKEKTEIEVAKLKGQYVEIQEIHRLWSNIAATVANRFVNLPRKLAPSLVMIDDPDRIEAIIARDVRDALDMIAQTPLPGESAFAADAAEEAEDE